MNHALAQLHRELKKNLFDYLLLFTAGVFFLISADLYKGERSIEFFVLVTYALFYIVWGVYHHIVDNSLHLKTVIEYILMAFTIIFLLKIIILP